jgi:hypothetical protein
MATEAPVQEEQVAPAEVPSAEADAQADAEFGAGFKGAHVEETRVESRPKTEPAKPDKPKVEAKAEAKVEPKVEAKAEPAVFYGLTETQVKTALAQAARVGDLEKQLTATHDKVFGTIGEIRQALKDLKSAPAGTPVKVLKDAFKKLTENGYGDLAESLAEDFSNLPLGPQSTFDQAAYDKSVDERVNSRLLDANKEFEKKLLTIQHKDWRGIYASDYFKIWRGTLPAEAQGVLDNSWDAATLSEALDDFKVWREKAKAPKQTTTASDKRLAAAVDPKTTASPPAGPSDDEAFETGFKNARSVG